MKLSNKTLNIPINHKFYTVDIGKDEDNAIENGIKKFIDLDKNSTTQDILLAYIQKTYELVALEKSLEEVSDIIEDISK
jgi:uncharacterized protein YbcC (UPF0753/DUF2309 family)